MMFRDTSNLFMHKQGQPRRERVRICQVWQLPVPISFQSQSGTGRHDSSEKESLLCCSTFRPIRKYEQRPATDEPLSNLQSQSEALGKDLHELVSLK